MRWLALSAVTLVSVVLGAHAGGGAADAQPSTLPTIAETLPTLSIDDVTTHETNVDTDAVLTVTLTPASSETVTVHWGTGAGTADSADYVTALHNYDAAFATFFNRLQADGINKNNTLFVVTADEGDHFVGGPPSPANCDGVHTPGLTLPSRTRSTLFNAQPAVKT